MTTQFQNTDLNIFRGDDTSFTLSILDSTGVGVNVASQTVYWQARSNADSIFPIFDSRSISGMSIDDSANGNSFVVGKIVLRITSAISKILPAKSVYDLRASNSGSIQTLASGNIIVKKDVSR